MRARNEKAIAIIGMSCRFPKAAHPEELWKLLKEGRSAIEPVPSDRWDMSRYYHPDGKKPNKTNQNVGGFLETIHHFDPKLFSISPMEAYEMSPSQKLMMELAWELFESSTMPFDALAGTNTGVYLGNIWADFEHFRNQRHAEINNFSGIGQSNNVIANRISYFFGLTGPSYVLDTGCSSSLIAVMQCVESLQNGKIDMGIAGGVNHILNPEQYVYLAKFGGLSSAGQCRCFDANADGFVRAEGAGLVLLKPLETAENDRDRILAVIRGGAFNNNGFNTHMPATSAKGQYRLLEKAYQQSGIDPCDVDYIETHGTGTRLGDPLEAEALGAFFGTSRIRKPPLLIGSVKASIGHTEAASGIAGLLKVVLAMQHREIPANIHFETPNPKIRFDEWHLEVANKTTAWPANAEKPLLAGVSSFGWGGSNAHIVLQEYKPCRARESNPTFTQKYFVLPLSASSDTALKSYAKKVADFVEKKVDNHPEALRHFCAAFAIRKPQLEFRKLVVATSREQLCEHLVKFHQSIQITEPVQGRIPDRTVFVFSGQGSQWHGMGCRLYTSQPVFFEAMQRCAEALKPFTNWSLTNLMQASEDTGLLQRIDVIQPYIFAIQVSLAHLWLSLGVVPDAVVGHSMGEVAAAHIAGVLTLPDAARIICSRSQLMRSLSGQGSTMAVVGLGLDQTREFLTNFSGSLEISVNNSPKSTVVSGSQEAINRLLSDLESKDLFGRQVQVDVASHSAQMDAITHDLLIQLENIHPQKGRYPLVSTVRRQPLQGTEMDAAYWVENLRHPVYFEQAINSLLHDGANLFIELSPHPLLKNAIYECAGQQVIPNLSSIGSLNREDPEDEEFWKNFAQVFERGHNIGWKTYYQLEWPDQIELPAYPMERGEFQLKDLSMLATRSESDQGCMQHPFIREKVNLAGLTDLHFNVHLCVNQQPLLEEHRVNDRSVFPAAFYIEMVSYVLNRYLPDQPCGLRKVKFHQPVYPEKDVRVELQLKVTTFEGTPTAFAFYRATHDEEAWQLTCSGEIADVPAPPIKSTCAKPAAEYTDRESLYQLLHILGVDYGHPFRNVVGIQGQGENYEAVVHVAENMFEEAGNGSLNPVLLDNALHSILLPMKGKIIAEHLIFTTVLGIQEIYLPKEVPFTQRHVVTLHVTHKQLGESARYSLNSTLQVHNAHGDLVLALKGVMASVADTGLIKPVQKTADTQSSIRQLIDLPDSQERIKWIQDYLIAIVAKLIKASSDSISSKTTFRSLGIDSLSMVQLWNRIEKEFQISITLKDFTKFPSPNSFARYIDERMLFKKHTEPEATHHDPWLIKSRKSNRVEYQLVLFYDAGGSTQLFKDWEVFLPSSFELVMVELPGHGSRMEEQHIKRYDQLLDFIVPKLKEHLNKPFSIFGHSMGGVLAFETACQLNNRYNLQADALIVSGTPYLNGYENRFINTLMASPVTDEQLLSLIGSAAQTAQEQLVKQLLETLRADFELLYHYPYRNCTVLNAGIVALHATQDDRVALADVQLWEHATSRGFTLCSMEGGHHAVYAQGRQAVEVVLDAIRLHHQQKVFS